MQRLLINNGRYRGECIPIENVLRQVVLVAREKGWEPVPIQVNAEESLPAFRRGPSPPQYQVYLSSGIHGDEPAGPLAMLRLFHDNQWPESLGFWVVPCLNPTGFVLNCRENEQGLDLNRDYREPRSEVTRAHIAWLKERPRFDLTLLLHEDWESNGFYLYELNPEHQRSCGPAMINQVRDVCPVDLSPMIEGRTAYNGIISVSSEMMVRPDWPEALYLIHHKTRLNFTLEAPSDYALEVRVNALVTAVKAALQHLSEPLIVAGT